MRIIILMKVTSDFCRIKFIEKKLKRKKKFLSDKSRLHPNNMIVGACIVTYDRAPTKDCDSIYQILSVSIEKYNV